MKYDALQQAAVYSKVRKRKKRWHKVVTCLAAIVVFCTAYALILPAITQERPTFCGYEEHTHSEECMHKTVTLSCDPSQHTHTDACYDALGNYLCGISDVLLHSHSEICYDADGALRCKLAQISAHEHSQECYGEPSLICEPIEHVHNEECYDAPLLICTEETQLHEHDETCYDAPILMCTNEDPEHTHEEICYAQPVLNCTVKLEAHEHDETCYAEPVLHCTQEYEAHEHTDMCYGQAPVVCEMTELVPHCHNADCAAQGCTLPIICEHVHHDQCFTSEETGIFCEKEEHIHNDYCYIDKSADVETAKAWEATLPQELSGVWAEDALSVALSQLGYHESETNAEITADGVVKGYSRYGAWYGDPYGDWCAMFASFCLNYAQAKQEFIPFEANCQRWVEKLTENELYVPAESHVIESGDLIFFDYEGDNSADHVGLVVELIPADEDHPARVKTIEGNSSNCVKHNEYELTNPNIMGYGDVSKAQKNYDLTIVQELSYTDDSVTVKATYTEAAQIPEGAQLSVKAIDAEASLEAYESCYQEAQSLLSKADSDLNETIITDFKLYDICFVLEGEEIQPSDTVDIQITLPETKLNKDACVSVIHYEDDGAQFPTEQEYKLDEEGVLNTQFETDSFSLFAVVTTESEEKSIVNMSQYSVTRTNVSQLNGMTFAIAAGDYALHVNASNALVTKKLLTLEDSSKTGDEGLARWTFEQSSGSNYYLYTTQADTVMYLAWTNGTLALVTERASATVFTAARTGTNLTLANSGSYLKLSDTGVSMGTSTALSLYTVPTGTFSVVFDCQIGNPKYMGSNNRKYTISSETLAALGITDLSAWKNRTTDASGMIKLPTPEETPIPGNYPLKLNGWYDIVNKVFYDSSMFGKEIKVTNDTIFYPEWIAETYDIGQDEGLTTTPQPDTSDFINTYVFDYTELFNTHSANYSTSDGNWYFDPDSELGFFFFDYLDSGNISYMLNKDNAVDGVTVNAEKTAGTRGSSVTYPGTITAGIANEKRLNALFGTDDTLPGRHYLGEGDWLYSYDSESGFYFYNSARNAAAYNQSLQRFYVYDYVENIDSQNSLNDFLPFNYGDEERIYKEKDNEANYWVGMKSEITFYLPDDSGTGKNKSTHGTDMQLRFSGDDDVWIYIDDELVLDLGGVHDVVYGEINFSTGVVRTGQAFASNNVAQSSAHGYAEMPGLADGSTTGITTTTLPTIEGGKEHKITIYYLERGSSLSNCAVYFNLSPAHGLQITKQESNKIKKLAGAVFQVFDDEACTTPSSLYLLDLETGERTKVDDAKFTTGEDGVVACWGLLAGRTYYIKEVVPPPGYPIVSDYVIKINLDVEGEAVITTLDSSGKEWTFADAYYRVDDTEHMIAIDVYNDKFISGDREIHVRKIWAEGSEDIPETITVNLLANGEETGRSMELNAQDDWEGTFYELPIEDADGNEIEYTVQEIVPEGFTDGYVYVEGQKYTEMTQEGYWGTATAFEDGRKYRILTSDGKAVSNTSSSLLSLQTAAEDDTTQNWIATALSGGFLLQNESSGRSLTIASSGVSASQTTSGNNVTITLTNGRLRSNATTWNRYYYLYVQNNSLASSYRSQTTFTIQVWNDPVYEEVDTPPVWQITNTPLPTKLDIPVQKIWDSTVSEESKKEISVSLYLVSGDGGAATRLASLNLNEANGWKGTFEDYDRPEEGSFYCIAENTTDFKVTYGENTVSVFIDGQLSNAAKVTTDDSGNAAQVEVTNAFLVVLPATGGSGTYMYTLGGLVMILASILLLYKHQKRRKEDRASS